MRLFHLLLGCLFLPSMLSAQGHLAGLWQGEITFGGLHNASSYPFELFLELDGDVLRGRTYIHLGKDDILEMEVIGRLYYDRSLSLKEYKFIPVEGSKAMPPFTRIYQMIYTRSIFDSTLEGYWQQDRIDPFNQKRDRGRIRLVKKEATKA